MNIYEQLAAKIIKEQELLMGPMAWYEAGKVQGLSVLNSKEGSLTIEGDGNTVINALVDQFGTLFGRAGREVCRDAVGAMVANLKPTEVPANLR